MGRQEVCQYLFDNVTRWLEDRFLDGLRFDSTVSIRNIQDQFENWSLVQAVPDFVARHQQDDPAREEVKVPVASGPLKLVLSWVSEEE